MAVWSEPELIQEIERLRAELARRDREAADKERQLERYAADLRETFKQERSRSQELQEAGADLFLTKPFSPLDLLRLVDRLSEQDSA